MIPAMAFPTTRWSLLAQATINGDAAQKLAWAEFYRRYREAVVGFIRRQLPDPVRAEDLAQEFFLHLMKNATLQRADPRRGRFRSFLRGALIRFLARDHERNLAEKRGSGLAPVSLETLSADEGEPTVPPAVALAFDREWAQLILERARQEVRAGWKGSAGELTTLLRFLPGAVDTPAYEAAASALGWPLARLKTEVHRLRGQFRELVRAEVALTVEEPEEIEAELTHLHQVLADPSA